NSYFLWRMVVFAFRIFFHNLCYLQGNIAVFSYFILRNLLCETLLHIFHRLVYFLVRSLYLEIRSFIFAKINAEIRFITHFNSYGKFVCIMIEIIHRLRNRLAYELYIILIAIIVQGIAYQFVDFFKSNRRFILPFHQAHRYFTFSEAWNLRILSIVMKLFFYFFFIICSVYRYGE